MQQLNGTVNSPRQYAISYMYLLLSATNKSLPPGGTNVQVVNGRRVVRVPASDADKVLKLLGDTCAHLEFGKTRVPVLTASLETVIQLAELIPTQKITEEGETLNMPENVIARGQHYAVNGSLFRVASAKQMLVEKIRDAGGAWVYARRYEWSHLIFPQAQRVSEAPGDLIVEITSWDAVYDGALVNASQGDLTEVTQQHFKWPVLYTQGVQEVLHSAVENPAWGNDQRGVWHDILSVATSPLAQQIDEHTRVFQVAIYGLGHKDFKAETGPSGYSDPRPVVIVSLPHED